MRKTKAFTLIELLVVVAIIALLISILLPSLSRAREITKRAVCAANIRGIGQGMKVYSNDNLEWYPTVVFSASVRTPDATKCETNVDFIGKLSELMTVGMNPPVSTGLNSATVHPSRCLFMLVSDGTCTANQFICPSSGDNADDMRNGQGTAAVAAQPGINRFDFKGYPHLSYGYQLPWGTRGQPNENLDARMVIAADKGPFFQAGTQVQERTPDVRASNFSADATIGFTGLTGEQLLQLDGERWRPYNSRNHQQEGENCLYQDGHAEFQRRPIAGVGYDNIYTIQNGYTLERSLVGAYPFDKRGPLTNTDSVIVP